MIFFSLDPASKEKYTKDLQSFFGDYIEIESYSLKEGINHKINGDLLMISTPLLNEYVKKFVSSDIEVIYPTRTILKKGFKELKKLEKGQRAMLVSNSSTFALDLLSLLHRIGIDHIQFDIFYPDMGQVPDLDLAVTPGQTFYVPSKVNQVIDIGWREFDISTLWEIALKLKINDETIFDSVKAHSKKIVPVSYGMHSILDDITKSEAKLSIILDEVDDAILMTNNRGSILHNNSALVNMLNINKTDLQGTNVDDETILAEIQQKLINKNNVNNQVIDIDLLDSSLLVTKKPLMDHNKPFGYVYIMKNVNNIRRLENKVRKTLAEKGHLARYTFDSIVGKSTELIKCKQKGMKIARLDKPVLIIGQTGTGKELFAQSIHNYSARKDNPFVAVNCAALHSELLESELFGYEEGAFTGAKKGGKEGLFELAHGGTLFLDEIGDISSELQAKLLRVLQEKEIMRIGGTKTFPVDVRIIAATNKDFKKLMRQGKLRKDLYYRLSVLNLKLPSLNDLQEDIPLLVEFFLQKTGVRKSMEKEVMDKLVNHDWDGNIRELENCVEYLAYMSDDSIKLEDLPDDFYEDTADYETTNEIDHFPELLQEEKMISDSILKIIKIRSAGRRTIKELLENQGIKTSEHEIRKILNYLQHKGFITYGKGRKGVELTHSGKKLNH